MTGNAVFLAQRVCMAHYMACIWAKGGGNKGEFIRYINTQADNDPWA